jgi:hypothetical protein
MKFKLTLWKSITSLVGGLILGFLAWVIFGGGIVCKEGPCPSLTTIRLTLLIIIFIVLIYFIWSLFQKKQAILLSQAN